MTIGSDEKKEIGKRYVGLRDAETKIHMDMPYIVLRESTYEKWLEELKDAHASYLGRVNTEPYRQYYFYEVSVD